MGKFYPRETNEFLNFYPQPVPEDSFVRMVSKAMELWDKHGATVISDAPTVHWMVQLHP